LRTHRSRLALAQSSLIASSSGVLVFFIYLLPAVELPRLSAVGAGKQHSRVRFIIA
jgi:hypothetical protein